METKPWGMNLKYAAAVAGLVVAVGLAIRVSQAPRGLGQTTFVKLMSGNPAIAGDIDWQHLKAMGVDVGATYTGLANDQERANYRSVFLVSIANGFRLTGARAKDFVRWRVQERSAGQTVYAADYPKKGRTILLTFSGGPGTQQLEGIEWLAPSP